MSQPPSTLAAGPEWNRRDFLRAAAIGGSALLLPRTGRAAGTDPVVVVLFLRGAADGLSLVVPQEDPDYYTHRPTLQIPAGDAVNLDDFFGFHPGLAALAPLYRSGDLAIVHASGSTDPTRSHFDAQDFMERAAPGNKSIGVGWLNRSLAALGDDRALAGITLDNSRDVSMVGPSPALAFRSIDSFQLLGRDRDERQRAIRARYGAMKSSLLGRSMTDAFSALSDIAAVPTPNEVTYPNSPLGSGLNDAAALIKADIGVRAITLNTGGWDTHANQVNDLAARTPDLAESLVAFHEDLGSDRDRTLLLVMTEFGRTAAENGGGGTEHGHASAMFALGGGISGGRVLLRDGAWPGLAEADLNEGRDLAVTTDFRDIFAEVLDRHLGIARGTASSILIGHPVESRRYPGLFT